MRTDATHPDPGVYSEVSAVPTPLGVASLSPSTTVGVAGGIQISSRLEEQNVCSIFPYSYYVNGFKTLYDQAYIIAYFVLRMLVS